MIEYKFFTTSSKSEVEFLIGDPREYSFKSVDKMIQQYIVDLQSVDYNSVFLIQLKFKDTSPMKDNLYIDKQPMLSDSFINYSMFDENLCNVSVICCDNTDIAYKLAWNLSQGKTDLCYSDKT